MIRKCSTNILNNALRFESLFLGTKSNPISIKNPIPGLLALQLHSSTDIWGFFFGLVHHIIKIEEKKSCNIWQKKLAN